MNDRLAELDQWLFRLEMMHESPERAAIVTAARSMQAAIGALPSGEYRDMAICKLTDTVAVAAVAANQPKEATP